ncbi:hypothetical protein [Erythrobacter mangrovi]|uniref:Uncharacterized protein n=1 Tax=Erythrobacter mangrovi TaxID=2739433 RepID=A0A7D3X8K9_9SPHN|nr:hypothetical protein [Erythrobacter mangrovi]QKG70215.1 hypothetical protein HQR01_01855 [Erythrobacter mangrovi]
MDQDERAARRFWLLQFMRLSGLALVLVGAMILAGTIEQSEAVGVALFVIGAVDFFVMPIVLARRWKSDE